MKKTLFLFISMLLQISSFAATRFWVGKGVNDNWNITANWSAATGGAGGATVPGSGDIAIFDGAGTGTFKLSCTVNINITLGALRSQLGFAGGTISQGSFNITVNGLNFIWIEGTFNGGSGLFTVGTTATDISISGGIFNIGTGGFRATGGGTFDITGGTMQTITGSFYSDKLFTMSGGTFTGGTADVRFRDKGFNLNGGTFNSTSNTLFISSSVFNIRSVPGWVHNNCTVNFDSTTSTTLAFGTGANNSVNFYKVIVNKTAPTSANDKLDFAASDTLIVLTDLDIIDGQLINNTAAVKLHGNFTGQSAFTQSNVDFLLVGSGNQTFNLIGASTSAMNGKLIIRKPTASLVTLLNPVTLDAGVGNTLAMEKGIIITTTANLLTIGNDTRCKNLITSSLTYYIEDDNTFVEGPVQKDGNDYFVFPVGNRLTVNGQKAAPISISGTTNNLTDLGGINSFWANYFPVDPANAGYNRNLKDVTLNNIQACEYWMLNRLAGIANAHVWVSYKNAGHSCGPDISADPTKLHVARWDGAKWADHGHGTFRNPSNYHICSNGDVTSFSPFTTASITALIVLPVTLKSFTGMNQDCRAFLQWETALEQNPGNFKIQQSADGINFITAAIVKSKGTAGTYSINLDQPVTTGYYRLEMPDLDGAKKYSDIISVKMNCKKDAENLQVLPNLINKGTILNLKYTVSQVKGLANIVILNEQGSKISRQNITVHSGINLFTVITAGLTPGVYFISIKGQGWQSSVKRVVIK